MKGKKGQSVLAVVCLLCMVICLAGCSSSKSEKAQTQGESFETVTDLNMALEFTVLELPVSLGFVTAGTEQDYVALDERTIGEVNYISSADGKQDLCVRTAKGQADCSGYSDVEYTTEDINEISVNVGTSKKTNIAWWTNGTYAYSITSSNMDVDLFESFLAEIIYDLNSGN